LFGIAASCEYQCWNRGDTQFEKIAPVLQIHLVLTVAAASSLLDKQLWSGGSDQGKRQPCAA
jgi:hypothetical protein